MKKQVIVGDENVYGEGIPTYGKYSRLHFNQMITSVNNTVVQITPIDYLSPTMILDTKLNIEITLDTTFRMLQSQSFFRSFFGAPIMSHSDGFSKTYKLNPQQYERKTLSLVSIYDENVWACFNGCAVNTISISCVPNEFANLSFTIFAKNIDQTATPEEYEDWQTLTDMRSFEQPIAFSQFEFYWWSDSQGWVNISPIKESMSVSCVDMQLEFVRGLSDDAYQCGDNQRYLSQSESTAITGQLTFMTECGNYPGSAEDLLTNTILNQFFLNKKLKIKAVIRDNVYLEIIYPNVHVTEYELTTSKEDKYLNISFENVADEDYNPSIINEDNVMIKLITDYDW